MRRRHSGSTNADVASHYLHGVDELIAGHERFVEEVPELRILLGGMIEQFKAFKEKALASGDERLRDYTWDIEAEIRQTDQYLAGQLPPEER